MNYMQEKHCVSTICLGIITFFGVLSVKCSYCETAFKPMIGFVLSNFESVGRTGIGFRGLGEKGVVRKGSGCVWFSMWGGGLRGRKIERSNRNLRPSSSESLNPKPLNC